MLIVRVWLASKTIQVCSKGDVHSKDDGSGPQKGIETTDQDNPQSEEVDLGVLLLDADGMMADMPSLNLPSPATRGASPSLHSSEQVLSQ